MSSPVIYEEKVTATWLLVILGIVTLAISAMLATQMLYGPIGSKPAPNIFFVIFIAILAFFTYNFRAITIKITQHEIQVSYGLFKTTLPLQDIEICEKSEISVLFGFGLRFARYKGRWIWLYNTIGVSTVALLPKNKRGVAFSTHNPDKIIQLLSEQQRT